MHQIKILGKVGIIRRKMVKGWVKEEDSLDKLTVELYINGDYYAQSLASDNRKRLIDESGEYKLKPSNYGFEFNLDDNPLQEGDHIDVKIKGEATSLAGSDIYYTCKKSDKKKMIIFGDSHSQYFTNKEKLTWYLPWLEDVEVETHVIHGASLMGLGRRKTKLNVSEKIKDHMCSKQKNIFCFGQVDLELGYYYRKIIKKETIGYHDFINILITHYFNFLAELNLPPESVIIKGLNLTVLKEPTFTTKYVSRIITENITSKAERHEYQELLNSKLEDFTKRNQATLLYNDFLKKRSESIGYNYFDINHLICDNDLESGINDIYCPSSFDHHLTDTIGVRKIHFEALKKMILD